MRIVFAFVAVALLAGCGPTNSTEQFTDWSYHTRNKQYNRYDGYTDAHVREEQWQTDPYWTQGEGLQRRHAEAARLEKERAQGTSDAQIEANVEQAAQSTPQNQHMDMPPERFVKTRHGKAKKTVQPAEKDDDDSTPGKPDPNDPNVMHAI